MCRRARRSHKALVDTLVERLLAPSLTRGVDFDVVTLPAKKWKWRAAASSIYLMTAVPAMPPDGVLFCSSMVNLSELVAMRRDLAAAHKVLYFHENQLNYPQRADKDRDYHLSWMQGMHNGCNCSPR